MAKIPFDIKFRPQIESGEYKVETREGRPSRVICWDCKGTNYPVLALIEDGSREHGFSYSNNGNYYIEGEPSEWDLFIITPETELSEFENKLRVICEDAVRESQLFPERTSEDFAKKHSAELLELARKELIEEQVTSDPRKTDLYKLGKADALEDLPRWKKADGRERFNERLVVLAGDNDLWVTNYAEAGEYYLPFGVLTKLPKEE